MIDANNKQPLSSYNFLLYTLLGSWNKICYNCCQYAENQDPFSSIRNLVTIVLMYHSCYLYILPKLERELSIMRTNKKNCNSIQIYTDFCQFNTIIKLPLSAIKCALRVFCTVQYILYLLLISNIYFQTPEIYYQTIFAQTIISQHNVSDLKLIALLHVYSILYSMG